MEMARNELGGPSLRRSAEDPNAGQPLIPNATSVRHENATSGAGINAGNPLVRICYDGEALSSTISVGYSKGVAAIPTRSSA